MSDKVTFAVFFLVTYVFSLLDNVQKCEGTGEYVKFIQYINRAKKISSTNGVMENWHYRRRSVNSHRLTSYHESQYLSFTLI